MNRSKFKTHNHNYFNNNNKAQEERNALLKIIFKNLKFK